jgi:drug/metabolite transporter (DMT)-like permease
VTPIPVADGRPAPSAVLLAFAALYLVWGSTYLAIRVAVETIPPFMMLGARFAFTGAVLYAWMRIRGAERPTPSEWRAAILTGGLMLVTGTGLVGVAEQHIPSGLAALLVSTTPLWMVLLAWLWKGDARPHAAVFAGIALGLVGVYFLFDTESLSADAGAGPVPGLLVLLASFSWSVASVHARGGGLPRNPFLSSAIQMIAGGVLLFVAATATGEWSGFRPTDITMRSWISLAYLVVFGSFVAFSAFVWLLRQTTPARVSTYAFVNPGVAVVLGWLILAEPFTARIAVALAFLTVSVVLIVRYGR